MAPKRPRYELLGRKMTSPAFPDEDEEGDELEAVLVPEPLAGATVLEKVVVKVELPEVMVETTAVTVALALLLPSAAAPVPVGVPTEVL